MKHPESSMPSTPASPRFALTSLRALGVALVGLGIDPRRLPSARHIPKYLAQYRRFQALGGSVSHAHPILSDFDASAGSAIGHYFHQDLLVASLVHQNRPDRHIDVGSRIDGFVAHVASFRKIEVIDVRVLGDTGHPNISFLRADLMDERNAPERIADSISCLHAIEHFGLGRYGDPLDPAGHVKGFNNIVRMLKPNGLLYISFPVGNASAVHFNAHRVFHPAEIFEWAQPGTALELVRFDLVDGTGALRRLLDPVAANFDATGGCGIYCFRKPS